MKTSYVLFVSCLLLASPLIAQEIRCSPDGTIQDCLNDKVFARSVPDSEASASETSEEKAARLEGNQLNESMKRDIVVEASKAALKTTSNAQEENDQAGVAAGGAQATSTFTDLIPWLNAAGLLSDSDASDGSIAVDLNFLLLRNRPDVKHDSQLKWVFDVSPTPFDPLISALPESVKEERTKELQGRIKDTADSELQYSYSVVTKKLGRDFRRQAGRLTALVAPIVEDASSNEAGLSLDAARARFGARLRSLLQELAVDPGKLGPVAARSFKDFTPEQQTQITAFMNETRQGVVREMAGNLQSIKSAVKQSEVENLAKLVLLQPQLTFSLNKKIRSEIVGPESWGLKVTWEQSFVSLNDFLKESGDACRSLNDYVAGTRLSIAEARRCTRSASKYMSDHAEQIKAEGRWKASVEYKKVDRWRFALPNDGIDLDRPKYDRIVASVGFGRAVVRTKPEDRVDFEASYDSNLDDDDTYKNRFVVTLTYTRRVGDLDLPFSIVYANKSEFLEGVDKQIGLHFGVRFRALDKE